MSQIEYVFGDRYEGELIKNDNSRNFLGIHTFLNGSRYEGYYNSDGDIEGFGCYYYGNGEKYIGFFKNGVKHGFGRYIYSNNDEFIGYFQYDLQNGCGLIKNKRNNSRFYCIWTLGLKEGNGIYYKDNIKLQLKYEKNTLRSIKKLSFI